MTLNSIFDIAGSALTAEVTRLKTTAANMGNANIISGSAKDVYKAQYPIFRSVQESASSWMGESTAGGVAVDGIMESVTPPTASYEPNHPMADAQGFVYSPNINYAEEMANMISASRSYQMDVEMMSTAKQLLQHTLQLGE